MLDFLGECLTGTKINFSTFPFKIQLCCPLQYSLLEYGSGMGK